MWYLILILSIEIIGVAILTLTLSSDNLGLLLVTGGAFIYWTGFTFDLLLKEIESKRTQNER